MRKEEKGITLIALVVTIVVLLILAGVSIAMLGGENGILNNATKAVEENEKAEKIESVKMAILESYNTDGNINIELLNTNLAKMENIEGLPIQSLPTTIKIDKYELGIDGELNVEQVAQKGIIYDENRIYKDETGIAILPRGFAVVEDADTIRNGLVISDVKNDNMNNDMKGNQFVWVPVDNSSEDVFIKVFQRQEGYAKGNVDIYFSRLGEATEIETTTTKLEFIKMYSSVKNNAGFYVGRFEVGKDNNENVVVKKGAIPYTNIQWSANGKMQETNETTGGAVEISRYFAEANNYSSVQSTLIYGVQWDAIMNFIDNNYITNATIGNPICGNDSVIRDSTGKGNYNEEVNNNEWKGSITFCGSSEDYNMKNIYDLAGNVREWTMETYGNDNRVSRGGHYNNMGANQPISVRYCFNAPTSSVDNLGFRITLFVC